MNSASVVIYLTRIVAAVALLLAATTALADPNISVSAKLDKGSDSRLQLVFEVRNETSQAVEVYSDDLPWSLLYRALIVVCDNAGPLPHGARALVQADPNAKTRLGPKSSVSGKVILEDLFPDVETSRNTNELVVFWTYKAPAPAGRTGQDQPRFGGWFSTSRFK